MVLCGVVWCGVVWCGVVWCGVVWCGVVHLLPLASVGLDDVQTILFSNLHQIPLFLPYSLSSTLLIFTHFFSLFLPSNLHTYFHSRHDPFIYLFLIGIFSLDYFCYSNR